MHTTSLSSLHPRSKQWRFLARSATVCLRNPLQPLTRLQPLALRRTQPATACLPQPVHRQNRMHHWIHPTTLLASPKTRAALFATSANHNAHHAGKKREHGEPDKLPTPERFADALTADRAVGAKDEKPRSRDTVSCIVLDRKTGWAQAFPAPAKSTEEVKNAFTRF